MGNSNDGVSVTQRAEGSLLVVVLINSVSFVSTINMKRLNTGKGLDGTHTDVQHMLEHMLKSTCKQTQASDRHAFSVNRSAFDYKFSSKARAFSCLICGRE